MAIDYGFWSTLSSGYQSAQDRRSQRDAAQMKELQLIQMLQQQQSQRIEQQNRYQLQLEQATSSANQILNSSFGRQKDIDDMKKWHSEHSGWGDVKDIITKYNGDITQARLYGNLDYYMNKYKMNINNPNSDPTQGNPILQRVSQNKANLEKFIAAQQNEQTSSLIMPGDYDRYNQFISGETDDFQFSGIRGDYDISSMIEDTDMGQEIDVETFYAHNMHAVLSDMSRDTGIDVGTLQQNPDAVHTWIKDALNWTGEPVYGEKKIETNYVNQFQSNLDELPALFANYTGTIDRPLTIKDVFNMENKIGSGTGGQGRSGFAALLEGRDPQSGTAYSDIWQMLGGYDANSRPHSKLGGTNVIAGHQLLASGQILTDPALQTSVLKAHYGEQYNAENKKLYGMKVRGLYTETGTMVTDDDVSGTWWERGIEAGAATTVGGAAVGSVVPGVGTAIGSGVGFGGGFIGGALGWNPFGEGEEMDLNYNGSYLGFRVRGLDKQTGQPTSFLVTKDSDESDIKKIMSEYGNMPVEVVMVNEFIDTDYTSSDDMYYDVVDLNNVAFRQQMDKTTDSESLSKVYNESLSYETKQKNEAFYLKQKTALHQNLADIYTEGNTQVLPEVANSYKQSIDTSLVVGGVSAENANLSSPLVMSWLLTETEKESGGDREKQNILMQQVTSNLSSSLNNPNNARLKEALMKGPQAFLDYYSKNTDKETFKKFRKTSRDWSKYFTLNR